MGSLAALLAMGVGAVLVLAGLVMIAPEVRVHRIRVYSAGSWVFRVGAALTLAGLLLTRIASAPVELVKIGVLIGGAALLGGLFVWNHERAQAPHSEVAHWDWPHSLTLQMLGAGVILLALALLFG
jgi:hypothetical protein